jgi:hypothetical protein
VRLMSSLDKKKRRLDVCIDRHMKYQYVLFQCVGERNLLFTLLNLAYLCYI